MTIRTYVRLCAARSLTTEYRGVRDTACFGVHSAHSLRAWITQRTLSIHDFRPQRRGMNTTRGLQAGSASIGEMHRNASPARTPTTCGPLEKHWASFRRPDGRLFGRLESPRWCLSHVRTVATPCFSTRFASSIRSSQILRSHEHVSAFGALSAQHAVHDGRTTPAGRGDD